MAPCNGRPGQRNPAVPLHAAGSRSRDPSAHHICACQSVCASDALMPVRVPPASPLPRSGQGSKARVRLKSKESSRWQTLGVLVPKLLRSASSVSVMPPINPLSQASGEIQRWRQTMRLRCISNCDLYPRNIRRTTLYARTRVVRPGCTCACQDPHATHWPTAKHVIRLRERSRRTNHRPFAALHG